MFYIGQLKHRKRKAEKRKLPDCGLVRLGGGDGRDQILEETSDAGIMHAALILREWGNL